MVKNLPDNILLSLIIKKSSHNGKISYLRAFTEDSINKYKIPFAFALDNDWTRQEKLMCARPSTSTVADPPFRSDDQRDVYNEMVDTVVLTRSCILSVHVGFGKTFLAIRLIAQLKLKTLIVIPTSKKILQEQWKSELATFYPNLKVQLVSASSQLDASANVYIIGTLTIQKIWRAFKNVVHFVVVDELHLALSESGYQNLLYLFPSYLLGLSATPYRVDGSDSLVELFFGRAQVSRKLYRKYNVRVITTPYKFPIKKTENGKVNWSALLTSQAECKERNELLAEIITKSDSKFLILCKRVSQIKEVRQLCADRGVDIQAVYGDLMPTRDHRSLIGHVSKLGVGFSDSSFNALLLGGDVQEYFIQYFGRVLRDESTCPTVYDLVDDCPILKKHYTVREKIYTETGGQIERLVKKKAHLTATVA